MVIAAGARTWPFSDFSDPGSTSLSFMAVLTVIRVLDSLFVLPGRVGPEIRAAIWLAMRLGNDRGVANTTPDLAPSRLSFVMTCWM
jgi:hypothetical protein